MIELVQFPWSPFCLVQRRILEFARVPFQPVNIPPNDRSLVWRLTRQRYYQVPVLKDGKTIVFETEDESQVIAKYLDDRLKLGLFPREWEGLQTLVWRFIENDIESLTFKLNDAYYEDFVLVKERLAYLRHKERKFGRGCLQQWKDRQAELQAELAYRLLPSEQMLGARPFLLDHQPRFVDFDLYGMLGNFLYSGHYELPPSLPQVRAWFERMQHAKRPAANPPA